MGEIRDPVPQSSTVTLRKPRGKTQLLLWGSMQLDAQDLPSGNSPGNPITLAYAERHWLEGGAEQGPHGQALLQSLQEREREGTMSQWTTQQLPNKETRGVFVKAKWEDLTLISNSVCDWSHSSSICMEVKMETCVKLWKSLDRAKGLLQGQDEQHCRTKNWEQERRQVKKQS